MEESSFPRAEKMHGRKRPKALLILIIFLLILFVLIFVSTRFLGTGLEEDSTETTPPTPVIVPSSTPMPTKEGEEKESITITPTGVSPTPKKQTVTPGELDRSSLSIQVLNGSGISGAAGKMQATLDNLGYTDVTTGNADAFDYEDISISVKSTKAKFLELLKKDLSDSYTIGDTDTKLTSGSYDAVIIIGQ